MDFPVPARGECMAKTRKTPDGTCVPGCSVFVHLLAVCLVLRELRRHFAGTPLEKQLPAVADWLGALHDIGKMTPLFLRKIYAALGIDRFPGRSLDSVKEDHARCSQILLEEQFGEAFARLAGAHHGVGFRLNPYRRNACDWLGGSGWDALRTQLLGELDTELELPPFDAGEITARNEAVLLGATILADWIGSGMDLSPEAVPDSELAASAVRQAGFLPFRVLPGLDFKALFGFPPNSLQSLIAGRIEPGAVYVVESEMGSGKTEAALYLGYRLLCEKKITGIYFALPTQLTSEKIRDRVNSFLQTILASDSPRETLLVHGDAWLDWNLYEETEDGESRRRPDSWFYSAKRALLAPFAVGTVDQALLSVINVKHRDLRAFGLAGKLVVIDEVHSYDYFTGGLIQELVDRLRGWGATVIILSATLTCSARKELLRTDCASSSAYPLVTLAPPEGVIGELPFTGEAGREVAIGHSVDESACLADAINRAAAGQQVLWVENTVGNAQRIYRLLESAAPQAVELGLLHSRYPRCEREVRESYWVGIYGKEGGKERTKRGRILVGTQILEQSIDIDADYLFSRLAPSDMILQRIGRLWRHKEKLPRPAGAVRGMTLVHDKIYQLMENLLYKTEDDLPYERYVLCRTQEVWLPRNRVVLPDEIRPILEATYAGRSESGARQQLKSGLERKCKDFRQMALLAASVARNTEDDDRACTRINDEVQVEVLLLENRNGGADLRRELRTLFGTVPIPPADAPQAAKKEALKQLKYRMVKVPEYLAPDYASFPLESSLEHIVYLGQDGNRPVRAAYRDDAKRLLDRFGQRVATGKHTFSYHSDTGYTKEEK